jgi:hypothetical protein
MTWQVTRTSRQATTWHHLGESASDTCHASIGCEGDTWPNHGLPRGTPVFVNMAYVKIFGVAGDRTRDLPNRLRLRIKSSTNGPPGGSC